MILDSTALLLLLNEKTPAPRDPFTKEVISNAHEKVVKLVSDLTAAGERVIVAAPVLAELLVRAENAASQYITEFNTSSRFRIVAFDQKAAIEHAVFTRTAIDAGDKRGGVTEDWAKVKFDRQIVAIAIACGAHTICTDDEGLTKHAKTQGINVVALSDLKLGTQMEMTLPNVEGKVQALDDQSQKEKGSSVVETSLPSPVVANHTSSYKEISTTDPFVNMVTPAGSEPAASTLARSVLYPSELRGPHADYSEVEGSATNGITGKDDKGILGVPDGSSEAS